MYRNFILIAFLFAFCACSAPQVIDIKEIKSKYGINALLSNLDNTSMTRVTFIFKKSGYAYDPTKKQGLANIALLMLQDGPSDKRKTQFLEETASLGAKISFDIDQDNFYCFVDVISENVKEAVALALHLMLYPSLNNENLTKAKEIQHSVANTINTDASYVAKQEFFKSLFTDSGYGNNRYGAPSTLENIFLDDVKSFIASTFQRMNFAVNFVGKVSEQEVIEILDGDIIDLPLTVIENRPEPKHKIGAKGGIAQINLNTPHNKIFFGKKSLGFNDDNIYNLLVLNHMLGGPWLGSVLMSEIREKKGYSYGIQTSILNLSYVNLFMGFTSSDIKNSDDVILLIKDSMKSLSKSGLSESNLEEAKGYIKGSFIIGLDGVFGVSDFLKKIQINNLSINYADLYLDGIANVKLDSLNHFISDFLDAENFTFINVGKFD